MWGCVATLFYTQLKTATEHFGPVKAQPELLSLYAQHHESQVSQRFSCALRGVACEDVASCRHHGVTEERQRQNFCGPSCLVKDSVEGREERTCMLRASALWPHQALRMCKGGARAATRMRVSPVAVAVAVRSMAAVRLSCAFIIGVPGHISSTGCHAAVACIDLLSRGAGQRNTHDLRVKKQLRQSTCRHGSNATGERSSSAIMQAVHSGYIASMLNV